MKKSALLILAAIFVIGIQSCSTDLQEEISPENLTITKLGSGNNRINTVVCTELVYVYFGNMPSSERNDFRKIAEEEWLQGDSIFLIPSICPDIEIWEVPCGSISNIAKNDEDRENSEAIDAEGSIVTQSDGGSGTSNLLTHSPVYRENGNFNYTTCLDIVDDNTPIIITDGDEDDVDPDNNPGLPIRNIR